MVQYHELSQFYDSLTRDQPYTSWRDIIEHYREHRQTLLDIGCGTGNLTTLLRGFDTVFGMDLSIDMLTLAEQKSSNVQWVEGDMTDFDLGLEFDIVTILCDSLNYLASEEEVKQTFESVYQHLTPGDYSFSMSTLSIKCKLGSTINVISMKQIKYFSLGKL